MALNTVLTVGTHCTSCVLYNIFLTTVSLAKSIAGGGGRSGREGFSWLGVAKFKGLSGLQAPRAKKVCFVSSKGLGWLGYVGGPGSVAVSRIYQNYLKGAKCHCFFRA